MSTVSYGQTHGNRRIYDVRGLSQLNKKLLKQLGAVGESENLFHEVGKKVASMTSVVSERKRLSEGK
ncbi:MAG: hypothetical protein J3Q66DRAFT_397786 [Benniella sp.]|nr:MAG: hypothetical protein J3Q66DRAFT_397786 [Benniella sp.]